MLMPTWILHAVMASTVSAWYVGQWQPAGPADSRSPCPMLNTLANHGYLPRDGKQITPQQLGDAVAAFNIQPEIAIIPAQQFLNATGQSFINLADLNRPRILQHPASLTRLDWEPNQQHLKANPRRIEDVIADSNSAYLTVDSLARSRLRLEAASKPKELTTAEHTSSLTEAALLLSLMMEDQLPPASSKPNPSVYDAPKRPVRIFLNEERFPTELGWMPPAHQLTIPHLRTLSGYISYAMERHRGDFSDE